jgi:hypothetical protein
VGCARLPWLLISLMIFKAVPVRTTSLLRETIRCVLHVTSVEIPYFVH